MIMRKNSKEKPFDKFKNEKKKGRDDEENPLDKFGRINSADKNNNNEEYDDENPLEKFRIIKIKISLFPVIFKNFRIVNDI